MQRVLIVDDSKTAQLRLKKMLARYDLAVDISFSAEEALAYLSYRSPAVIFMDHHMEGMDGFEALKIIKANPTTAMIPVIMYTAQKGDVYVGQARALGALDILSKEVIKPAGLERVLSSLKITPKPKNEIRPKQATVNTRPPTAAPPLKNATTHNSAPAKPQPESSSLEHMRTQVARLFELHIADVRQQMADNARFIIRRLSHDIEKNGVNEAKLGDVPLAVISDELNSDRQKSSIISSSLLLLIFMGLAVLAYELFNTKRSLGVLGTNYHELLLTQQKQLRSFDNFTTSFGPQKAEPIPKENNPALLETLSWALDSQLQFHYNQMPLNETQMLKIGSLMYQLASAGFTGNVDLTVHFGNFCLQSNASGEWQLADEFAPLSDCTFTQDLNLEYSASNYVSMAYLNFEQEAPPIRDGSIDMNVTSAGLDSPFIEYPPVDFTMPANVWNRFAAQNNRISIQFNGF
ncbi:response regulator [Teredinibacter purpureus]|uniref:response regulator n=1 Tax=Teredinibacter purpureus TaxID=2731756 RepID=UPI0005F81872|nr:response regulator [Teredinibacter purpureus]